MDERRPRRLEPLPAGGLAALLVGSLLLVMVVAGASRVGDTGPAGPAASPDTGAAVIRAIVILFAIGEAIVLVLIGWALWPSGRRRRIQSRGKLLLLALASFLQTAAALVLVWLYVYYHGRFIGGGAGILSAFGLVRTLPSIPAGPAGSAAGGGWVTAAIVASALAVGVAYGLRGIHFRRPGSPLARLAAQLQEAVDDSLEGLEAEPDPRRAVIGAYARMERSLAGVGMPRSGHETSLEYLDRLLTMLDAPGAVVRRLTDLFQVAKFSDHPIGEEMKQEAIALLVELREYLRGRESAEPVDRPAVPA
jgi:hypothetical protein